VAKKARTPKPPRANGAGARQVQAPQKRSGASTRMPATSSTSATGFASKHFWPIAAVVVLLAILGIGLGIGLTRSSTKLTPSMTGSISWHDLPGLQTKPPPWPANSALLTARVGDIGLQPPSQEMLVYHHHAHLDLYVDGKKVIVPQYVGIQVNQQAQSATFAEMHTHYPDGVIHIETGRPVTFNLAQFFGVWGVRLTRSCIGSFSGSCGRVQMWVNGKKYLGDPAKLVLKEHMEIVLASGKPPATIPSTFDFARLGE
jgi:hypothetical protein